jgi:hypothetical protein
LTTSEFAPLSRVADSAKQVAFGAANCSSQTNVTIAIGTSNDGSVTGAAHGQAWAYMVKGVADYVSGQSWSNEVTIRGAVDIEPGFSAGPTATKNWVDGYASVPGRPFYYNFGSANGCPPVGTCDGGWSQQKLWYVSWGAAPAFALPLIYENSGDHARQWQQIALYGAVYENSNMVFSGVMTQYFSCIDPDVGCGATEDNTPQQGWQQLYTELNADPATAQPVLSSSTDIHWP